MLLLHVFDDFLCLLQGHACDARLLGFLRALAVALLLLVLEKRIGCCSLIIKSLLFVCLWRPPLVCESVLNVVQLLGHLLHEHLLLVLFLLLLFVPLHLLQGFPLSGFASSFEMFISQPSHGLVFCLPEFAEGDLRAHFQAICNSLPKLPFAASGVLSFLRTTPVAHVSWQHVDTEMVLHTLNLVYVDTEEEGLTVLSRELVEHTLDGMTSCEASRSKLHEDPSVT
mmetsp:Transcript_27010/g.58799  ORF Transcript_27010/g.58799 Transcript_27010/m.58799 type:complete len:226 (-) Transcript_27010:222-899(-)